MITNISISSPSWVNMIEHILLIERTGEIRDSPFGEYWGSICRAHKYAQSVPGESYWPIYNCSVTTAAQANENLKLELIKCKIMGMEYGATLLQLIPGIPDPDILIDHITVERNTQQEWAIGFYTNNETIPPIAEIISDIYHTSVLLDRKRPQETTHDIYRFYNGTYSWKQRKR